MAKILSIGQAVYREENSIQISEPDDWGWVYNSNDGDMLIIQVHKDIYGKWVRTIPYHVFPNPQIDVTDLKVEHRNDLPYSVKARIVSKDRNNKKAKSAPVLFKRISLMRFSNLNGKPTNNALLEPESGYHPTLFIFMLGGTGSGKTCWLNALSTRRIQDKIFSQRRIHYFYRGAETSVAPEATKMESITFHPFFLSKKKDRKVQAVVFIVDVGGEIGNYQRNEPQIEMLRDSIVELASGIFVVRSEKWLLGQEMIQNDPNEFIILGLSQKEDNDLGEDKFCYILTCADKIKKILEEKKENVNLDLAPDSPIFTQTNCTAEQMYQNMAIASDIMKRRDGNIGNSPCFAVSCCSNTGRKDDKTGREILNFGEGYNADLPIVYMLQRLVKTK